MLPPKPQLVGELERARMCLQGDPEALAALHLECHKTVGRILLSKGATPTETEDLLADLWADCVPGDEDRPSLLEKFRGQCDLQRWLALVAKRRWIDLKRKQAHLAESGGTTPELPEADLPGRPHAEPAGGKEVALVNILGDSLQSAFAGCPPESMVMLRLRYMHNVSQREIVRMLDWHEAKVSRALSQAMRDIKTSVLREIKKRDPWLVLTWQDFLDLCETEQWGLL